jgi:hypothetical protein
MVALAATLMTRAPGGGIEGTVMRTPQQPVGLAESTAPAGSSRPRPTSDGTIVALPERTRIGSPMSSRSRRSEALTAGCGARQPDGGLRDALGG